MRNLRPPDEHAAIFRNPAPRAHQVSDEFQLSARQTQSAEGLEQLRDAFGLREPSDIKHAENAVVSRRSGREAFEIDTEGHIQNALGRRAGSQQRLANVARWREDGVRQKHLFSVPREALVGHRLGARKRIGEIGPAFGFARQKVPREP